MPERHVVVTPGSGDSHERLGHEAGDQAMLAGDLCADLAIGRETVRVAHHVVKHRVEFQLSGSVLVVALDDVQAHRLRILDDFHERRAQLLELVNVVAVRLGDAAIGPPILAALEPHHFRLRPGAHVQAVEFFLELVVDDAQVAPAVGGQMSARILALLAVAEAGAENAGHALVPRQLAEGFRVGDPHQFRSLRAVADVVAVPVNEEVGGGAVNQLKPLFGNAFPVIRRNPFSDNPPGDGDELVVDVGDAKLVDLFTNLLHQFIAPLGTNVSFQVSHCLSREL